MFIEKLRRLWGLCDEVDALKGEVEELKGEVEELKGEVEELKGEVAELSKKKISDTTTEEDEPVSTAQIFEEYLNGADEE